MLRALALSLALAGVMTILHQTMWILPRRTERPWIG
jgi:hypothetical protein